MSDIKGPYRSGITDELGVYCLEGPGEGFGYYGPTLYSHLCMGSAEEADKVAVIANIAYVEGYARARRDIRKAIGV